MSKIHEPSKFARKKLERTHDIFATHTAAAAAAAAAKLDLLELHNNEMLATIPPSTLTSDNSNDKVLKRRSVSIIQSLLSYPNNRQKLKAISILNLH